MTGAFEWVSPRLYRNVEAALVGEAALIVERGRTVTVRGATTRELLARTFTITDPLQRVVALPHRHNHLAATIVDTLWVLSGRNDIAAITPYLPRAPQYSEDGTTWQGGYGPRLRHWRGTDQLDYVRRVLLADPHTRRAVISLYDPAADSILGLDAETTPATPGRDTHAMQTTRADLRNARARSDVPRGASSDAQLDVRLDVPCNNWLHFLMRDGRLDMFVVARSNDLIWGFSGINAFQWSVLHELMARWVGASVGRQHWAVSSMHVYERHLERARRIVANWDGTGTYTPSSKNRRYEGRWERFDSDLANWFEIERELRTANEPHWDPTFTDRIRDPFLLGCLTVVEDYWRARANLQPDHGDGSGRAEAVAGTDLAAGMRSFRDHRLPGTTEATSGVAVGSVLTPAGAPVGTIQSSSPLWERQWAGQAGEVVARIKEDLRSMHRMKSAAYGDSWKRRGELLGVLPNVARKIDRLRNQVNWHAEDRESEADTWADLVTYLLKYQTLLADRDPAVAASLFGSRPSSYLSEQTEGSDGYSDGSLDGGFSDGVAAFEELLSALTAANGIPSPHALDADLDGLQKLVETSSDAQTRYKVAGRMASEAFAGLVAAATGSMRTEP